MLQTRVLYLSKKCMFYRFRWRGFAAEKELPKVFGPDVGYSETTSGGGDILFFYFAVRSSATGVSQAMYLFSAPT